MENLGENNSSAISDLAIRSQSKVGYINEGVETGVEAVDKREMSGVSTLTKDGKDAQCNGSLVIESRGWGARHTMCIFIWLACFASYVNRVSLSLAIVSMVSSNITYNNTDSKVCRISAKDNETHSTFTEGEFDWDETTQGILLGCFYYGYLVSNILGGIATEYFGGRLMMTITVLGSSIMTLLSPVCARVSLGLFIAVRVTAGLMQGPLLSATYSLMATWVPPQERAKLCSATFTGGVCGTVVSMALGGVLIDSGFLGGWPSVFYVFGVVGVIWTIPWLMLVRNRPEDHPRISAKELNYINANASTLKGSERVKIPWLSIATSMPFWSLVAISWGNNFGFYNLLTEIPSYLKNIQHFGIEDNGFLSALPYIMSFVFSICWGVVANYLISSKKLSILKVRKLSSSVSMFGAAAGMVAMCFVDCNSSLAVACLCISVGVNAASNSGGDISEQDIAPNMAGALKGITNAVGSLTGILAPYITGAITDGNQTLGAWRTVFSISALTYCVCCIIYLVFGTDKVQPWNEPKKKKETNKF